MEGWATASSHGRRMCWHNPIGAFCRNLDPNAGDMADSLLAPMWWLGKLFDHVMLVSAWKGVVSVCHTKRIMTS